MHPALKLRLRLGLRLGLGLHELRRPGRHAGRALGHNALWDDDGDQCDAHRSNTVAKRLEVHRLAQIQHHLLKDRSLLLLVGVVQDPPPQRVLEHCDCLRRVDPPVAVRVMLCESGEERRLRCGSSGRGGHALAALDLR